MRDEAYEQQIETIQQEMLAVLDELRQDLGQWKYRDLLAAQRALQVVIESLVRFSRYTYQQKYNVTASKSRQGLDGLLNHGDLSEAQHTLASKMIGFRNVLVHDYLDVNRKIVESIISSNMYSEIKSITDHLKRLL
ncbi:type VII toxin-antitoxin system HepT family RNase toxin [Pelagibaculum spongiae]|uniref:DUF86 domain-containing protein n=1 Tax=Pelagibaculum spongiae TaxID=2080658 RepID=A0A2V1H1F4_9GAMM|nr:HepT-like ribonuclease domain-containing protein [Pelagibaculum spongiae]PVZ72343.1 DUF86 domain-containing protein [Pelagibaculum spongiae]